jgi:pilus assembly protein Flp/PilA
MRELRRLWFDDGGATAVEYALIVGAVATLIIVVVFAMGTKVKNLFNNVATAVP